TRISSLRRRRRAWRFAATAHAAAQALGRGAGGGLLCELLDTPEARFEHGAPLRELAGEDRRENVERRADVIFVRVLEQLEVHVLLFGKRKPSAQEIIGRLGYVGPPLGVQEAPEQLLALLRLRIGVGSGRQNDAPRRLRDPYLFARLLFGLFRLFPRREQRL